MRLPVFGRASIVALALSASAFAAPQDAASARELAKQGYELKQQKNWEPARQKYEESVRLDPTQKSLINLAECEAELGKLLDAQRHLLEARDAAKSDPELQAIAVARLAAVEKRLPRLTIRLAPGAPSGTVVARDGVELREASLDTALPVEPGPHTVLVRSPGRLDQRADVTLVEGEVKQIDVAPGAPVAAPAPATAPTPAAAPPKAAPVEPSSGPWRTVGLVTMGVGAAGVVVGAALAISANAAKCPNNVCATEADKSRHLDARSRANVATVAFAAGGGLIAGGALVWIFGSSGRAPQRATGPGLGIGVAAGDVVLVGAW